MSFRIKLFVISLSSLFFLAFTAGFFFLQSQSEQKELLKTSFYSNVASLNEGLAAQFYERYGDAQAFALNKVFQGSNKEAMTKVLNDYAVLYGIYDVIIFVSIDGKLQAVNSVSPANEKLDISAAANFNFKNTDWFKKTMASEFTEDKSKNFIGTYVEDPRKDDLCSLIYKKECYGNGFTAQVKNDNGEIIGLISNRANFKWVEYELTNLFDRMEKQGLHSSNLVLINNAGKMIADYEPKSSKDKDYVRDFEKLDRYSLYEKQNSAALDLKKGNSGVHVFYDNEKKKNLMAAYIPMNAQKFINAMGWGIIINTPEDQLFESVNNARNFFLLSLLTILVISIPSLWYLVSGSAKSLEGILESVIGVEKEIQLKIEQLGSASKNLAAAALTSASSVEETSASVEEIHSMLRISSDSLKASNTMAGASFKSATEGVQALSSLVNSIEDLSESSKKIQEFTTVIDDIAFQTNLLALNAAVEAARAGEQGRGFAVVAEAVRNLAQKSGHSAKEINLLVKTNVEKIDSTVQTLNQCQNSFSEVLSKSEQSSKMSGEISESSHAVTEGVQQISLAIQKIDELTQTNSSTAQEVSSVSIELSTQTGLLATVMEKFQSLIRGDHKKKD
jgi:methyl-accepting chemotaxis protein